MKKLLIALITTTLFGILIAPSYANDAHHPKADEQQSYVVKGEVVVIDQEAGKVKLKHEAVPELKWPGMTMFFPVADKVQLDTLKVGDQVEFEFTKTSSGPVINKIKPIQ